MDALQSYNTLYLFSWQLEKDRKINRDYYWNLFFENGFKNGGLDTTAPSLHLPEKINNSIFQECVGTKLSPSNEEYRLFLQRNPNIDSIESTLSYVEDNPSSELTLKMMGLLINPEINISLMETISYIQPFLEESNNKYTNLDYTKLLELAKNSSTERDPNKLKVKELLHGLARNDLSVPKLVKNGDWLILTKP